MPETPSSQGADFSAGTAHTVQRSLDTTDPGKQHGMSSSFHVSMGALESNEPNQTPNVNAKGPLKLYKALKGP